MWKLRKRFIYTQDVISLFHGTVNFIESGTMYKELYDIFYRKFDWVRNDPWKEGEAPFVQVEPYKKISWGLDWGGQEKGN